MIDILQHMKELETAGYEISPSKGTEKTKFTDKIPSSMLDINVLQKNAQ